ncbi:FAD-dependent oxidoreductase [Actinacidiphila sp. bgisy144]|uniref:FAD-dependent oxidoreductase n=1 Tax=Actinacidiphila sp. bgisy144 TaxID=3413791 RepID=UPI003EBB5704
MIGPRATSPPNGSPTGRLCAFELGGLPDLVTEHFPGLLAHPTRLNVYMDGSTPDGQPVLGPLPGTPEVVVAGFSGRGFKMAPAIGHLMAELAVRGGTATDLSHFDPARFLPEPGVA